MSKPYRELVALQVTFSKVTPTYRIVHFYRWKTTGGESGNLSITGYDMDIAEPAETVKESLRNAYAPATVQIWKQAEAASDSELLQFTIGARPDELGLEGTWSLWAQL